MNELLDWLRLQKGGVGTYTQFCQKALALRASQPEHAALARLLADLAGRFADAYGGEPLPLDVAERALNRLTRLVESLLILTRADSGKFQLAPERLDLGAVAGHVIDQLRILADEKQQKLSLEAPIHVRAMGDAALIRHALMNLIHNAIKYTPNCGAITVEVHAIGSGQAVIEVRDTGPGVPAVHRERIFDRFYRVDASRSREEGGVGLGLAIARWAIEANSGRIDLVSDGRNGSSFRVLLPVAAN